MQEIGPVDYAVIGFPDNQFKGEIIPAIQDLVDRDIVRIIDAAFVGKDETGEVYTLDITNFAPDIQAALASMNADDQGLLNDDDLVAIGEQLEPNSSGALLVWENVWARSVAQAIRDAGGVLVALERVPHETVEAAREWVLEKSNA